MLFFYLFLNYYITLFLNYSNELEIIVNNIINEFYNGYNIVQTIIHIRNCEIFR
jgi:hypothetical protein